MAGRVEDLVVSNDEIVVLAVPAEDRIDGERCARSHACLLYTSDAADERSSVDLGGRRIIKKKNIQE